MTDNTIKWLRDLAEKGGKGVVNNIDARSLGRVADELERLQTAKRAALKMADERSKENVRLRECGGNDNEDQAERCTDCGQELPIRYPCHEQGCTINCRF